MSAEVYRLYGLDPTSTVNVSELIANSTHPEDTARTRDALQLAIQGVQPYNIEHRIVRPDGEVRWMHAQAELVRDADGQPLTLLGTVQDITARKWAEAAHGHLESQLRGAQKMDALGTLAGGIAHDSNMPKASGRDVARAIARIRPGLPVVITSGYITDALREGARDAGVRNLVYKPNSIEELVAAIAQLLELEVR